MIDLHSVLDSVKIKTVEDDRSETVITQMPDRDPTMHRTPAARAVRMVKDRRTARAGDLFVRRRSKVPVDVVLCSIADLTEEGRADLAALSLAVYPPEVSAGWPGRHWEWSAHESAVLTRTADGELICYIGLVVRSALYGGRPVQVGGIGGVKTHPAARRQGYAAQAVRRAISFFHERGDIGFGLLVCEPHLLGYYGRLGWQEFGGRLLVTQRGVPVEFTLNRVMVCAVQEAGPCAGTIDLLGPPW